MDRAAMKKDSFFPSSKRVMSAMSQFKTGHSPVDLWRIYPTTERHNLSILQPRKIRKIVTNFLRSPHMSNIMTRYKCKSYGELGKSVTRSSSATANCQTQVRPL